MKKMLLALFVLMLSISLGGVAYAATAAGSLAVSSVVADSCALTTSPVGFTGYTGVNSAAADGTISVQCSSGTSYVISLGGGDNYGALIASYRSLTDGTNLIPYELYKTATPLTANLWGDDDATHPASSLAPITANGGWFTMNIYGLLRNYTPLRPAGTYGDTVAVTITY